MKSNPDYEHLFFPVEYKFADKDKGIVDGYGAIFSNEDFNREIAEPGLFKKSARERVPRGLVPYLDSHRWDIAHTIGSVLEAHEDSHGLHYRAQLSNAPSAQDARIKMLEGHIKTNSVGYKVIRDGYQRSMETKALRRHLYEARLLEISALPVAANEEAQIISVKSVVPFEDLDIAPRERAWDPEVALKRVVEWAGGTYAGGIIDESKINWARFRSAFVGLDPECADQVIGYKMPIADVIGGELVAIPRAIEACAKAADLGEGDDSLHVRTNLERYYEKMRAQFKDESIAAPWESKAARGGFLVSDASGDHLPTEEDGKISHALMGAAWAALHGGYRGNVYEGPGKAEAIAKLKKLYEKEGIATPDEKKSVDALILDARELGVYEVSQIRDAARELFGFLKPAELKQLLDEFSAGPGKSTHGNERDAGMARVKRRSVLLNSEITRRRIS